VANEIVGFDLIGIIRATDLNSDESMRHEPWDTVGTSLALGARDDCRP
jgi:hypothetical protein